jgi:uncharacterized protein (DUF433 family)
VIENGGTILQQKCQRLFGGLALWVFGVIRSYDKGDHMATLDWSQCPAVASVPGRLSGAWVFKDTRMPVAAVFENLEVGSNIEEIMEQHDLTREQIQAVLEFAARSLDARAADRIHNVEAGA